MTRSDLKGRASTGFGDVLCHPSIVFVLLLVAAFFVSWAAHAAEAVDSAGESAKSAEKPAESGTEALEPVVLPPKAHSPKGGHSRGVFLTGGLTAPKHARTHARNAAAKSGSPASASPAPKRERTVGPVTLVVGSSKVLHMPGPVQRVAVADPNVADVKVIEPNEVLLVGEATGATDLIVWGDGGAEEKMRVLVDIDLPALNAKLAEVFPGSSINVSGSQQVYFLKGSVQKAEQVEQLRQFLKASGLKYVDTTALTGLQQVQIQVRVAEVNRVAIRKLGVNMQYAGAQFFGTQGIGPDTSGAFNPPAAIGPPVGTPVSATIPFIFTSATNVSPLVSLLAGFPDSNIEFFIQALAENQYLQILAEPNLVALSGEEASFLSGGEIPIPVVQGGTANTGVSISIQYKEYGISLKCQPVVLGDGVIRLRVAPEVSDLSSLGAVSIQGFQVPSLLTRKSETTVELKSGQTFAMAGLLSHSVNAANDRVPVLGNIPVVGGAFRSVRHEADETELVILVNAKLVEPLSEKTQRPLPGESDASPDTWQLFVQGAIQGPPASKAEGANGACNEQLMEILGKLKGPGAWASFR